MEQFERVLRKLAHEIAIDAIANLQGGIRIIAYDGRLSTVETDKHSIRFSASHISYAEHSKGYLGYGFGFDVEEKLYSTSDDSTKISYYAPEGKAKEMAEKVSKFIEKIMVGEKIIPRFTLAQARSS